MHRSCLADGAIVLSSSQNSMKEQHFSARLAEVGQQAATRRSPPTPTVATSGYRRLQHSAAAAVEARAPPATNRRTRLVAARSDYRHKTANLPTNDCFSVDHVIWFRAGEIARWCFVVATHNYRSENFVTASRRPTTPLCCRSRPAMQSARWGVLEACRCWPRVPNERYCCRRCRTLTRSLVSSRRHEPRENLHWNRASSPSSSSRWVGDLGRALRLTWTLRVWKPTHCSNAAWRRLNYYFHDVQWYACSPHAVLLFFACI